MILSVVFFNLLFRARDKILYKFDNREIGRQFLMFAGEPFFGISLMFEDLKVAQRFRLSENRNLHTEVVGHEILSKI